IFTGKASAYWYDADAFYELLQAAQGRTARDVIEDFEGCSGAQAGKIAESFRGRPAASLSREEAEELLQSAREFSNPVKPNRLACLDPKWFNGKYAKRTGTLTVNPGRGGLAAELPYTVESWCYPLSDERDHVVVLVNRTPV